MHNIKCINSLYPSLTTSNGSTCEQISCREWVSTLTPRWLLPYSLTHTHTGTQNGEDDEGILYAERIVMFCEPNPKSSRIFSFTQPMSIDTHTHTHTHTNIINLAVGVWLVGVLLTRLDNSPIEFHKSMNVCAT